MCSSQFWYDESHELRICVYFMKTIGMWCGVVLWCGVVVVPTSGTARGQGPAQNDVTTTLAEPHTKRKACCQAFRLVCVLRAIDHRQQKQ